MFTCGRTEINSLITRPTNRSVSRCNFILFQISTKSNTKDIIVISGWSMAGTRCISRENKNAEQYVGNQSFMRFGCDETFVLDVGEPGHQEFITFNPKTCVVCLENKCEIRGSCKHATLCRHCYETNKVQKCPICRQNYITGHNNPSVCVNTYNP
jgi:hypothetical protein